jgi:hypothetical protein
MTVKDLEPTWSFVPLTRCSANLAYVIEVHCACMADGRV